MLTVYFDTSAYSHIEKGWIAKEIVDALREALLSRKLNAHLSVTNIEELLGQWKTDRPAAIRKLRLVRDLVGFEKLLKPPNVLLEEAIRAYADETSPPSPFLPDDQRRTVVSSLRRIENGDVIIDGTVSGIINQVDVLKQSALEQWTEGRREVHATLSPVSVETRHPQRKDINWFLKSEEQTYAEGLAKTVGLDKACRRRGLDGLVNVRAVRFFVNPVGAYVFDITIGKESQPRAPKRGDDYDFWHIISTSTADAFVSYDARLVELLMRLPIDDFRVFSSIPTLLEEVV
jgi:predicted nucleic acid-binding protein